MVSDGPLPGHVGPLRLFQSALRFAVVSDCRMFTHRWPAKAWFQSALRFAVVSDMMFVAFGVTARFNPL